MKRFQAETERGGIYQQLGHSSIESNGYIVATMGLKIHRQPNEPTYWAISKTDWARFARKNARVGRDSPYVWATPNDSSNLARGSDSCTNLSKVDWIGLDDWLQERFGSGVWTVKWSMFRQLEEERILGRVLQNFVGPTVAYFFLEFWK